MAGDWIKLQTTTPDKPEVFAIAESLGIDPDAVVGKLCRIWIWADQQTIDGHAVGVTRALLDRVAGVTGFASAMETAGWLRPTEGGFEFPRFDDHNGATAKTRALSAKRSAKLRKQPSRNRHAPSVTKRAPREEKRREELKKEEEAAPLSADADSPATEPPIAESATAANVVLAEWNMLGLPFAQCRSTAARRKAIGLRLADPWWLDHWRDGLERVRGSPFCRGENDRGWVADIDWFLRPETLTKILEGKYDARESKPASRNGAPVSRAAAREAANANAFATLQAAIDAQRAARGGDAPDGSRTATTAALCDEKHSGVHPVRP